MLTLDEEIDELSEYATQDAVEAELDDACDALEALKAHRKDLLRFAAACEKAAKALAEVVKQAPAVFEARAAIFAGESLDLEARLASDSEWTGLSLAESEPETEHLSDIVAALEENATAAMRKLLSSTEGLLEDVIERNEEWLGDDDGEDDEEDATSDEEE